MRTYFCVHIQHDYNAWTAFTMCYMLNCVVCVLAHVDGHTLTIVTGEVFTWGSGTYGRLGHGNLRDRFSPLMIGVPLREIGVTFIACHEYHSAAVAGKKRI